MKKGYTRRSFIKGSVKGGLLAIASIAAKDIALPESVRGASPEELATLIDIRKCIGCEACVDACKEVNNRKFPEPKKSFPKMYPNRVKVADWSERRGVRDRLTPYNWVFIQSATVTVNGQMQTLTFPRRCMHCQNPPCADLCPFGAARKLKNGITLIHPELCLGGSKCKDVCPWDIPERQTGVGLYLKLLPSFAGNGVMYKCDRCYDRIEKGDLPACIEVCPTKVQEIGLRHNILMKAHKIAKEIDGYIYGERENGGTNTIYVSPVPFEDLNKAIGYKGRRSGRPHFDRVPNMMAHADRLAKAMFIAPFAGMAAAFLGLIRHKRNIDE